MIVDRIFVNEHISTTLAEYNDIKTVSLLLAGVVNQRCLFQHGDRYENACSKYDIKRLVTITDDVFMNIGDLVFYFKTTEVGWYRRILTKLTFYLMSIGIRAYIKNDKIYAYNKQLTEGCEIQMGTCVSQLFVNMEDSRKIVKEIFGEGKEVTGLYTFGLSRNDIIRVVTDATNEWLILRGIE